MTEPRTGSANVGAPPARTREGLSGGAGLALFGICVALLLIPLVAVEYPPVLDYPNHLARVYILTHPEDPHLSRYWAADWSILPNLGFDLVALALAQVMPVEMAGRVFLGLSIGVMLGAPLVLHRALYGRFSPLPLMAGALVFNRAFQMGFLGYSLGVGLALWAFAGWIALRDRGTGLRLAMMQGAALVLFVCHLYAMCVLAVAVVLSAASSGWRTTVAGGKGRLRGVAAVALLEASPFLFPLALLLAVSDTGSGSSIAYEEAYLKLVMLPLSMLPQLSVLGLLLVAMSLSLPFIAWLKGGQIMHPQVRWSAGGMLALYLVMPYDMLSSENADWRLLVPLALIVLGSAEDPFHAPREWIGVALLAVGVNGAAAWNVWGFWRGSDQLLANFHAATAPVERGALLVPWIPGDPGYRKSYGPPSVVHIAALAVIERSVLMPTVFAIDGQQPIKLRDPYGVVHDWHDLLRTGSNTLPATDGLDLPGHYVLQIRVGGTPSQAVPALPVEADVSTRAGRFTLWRLD